MISWFSAMLGPIFAKEMVEMSRRVRYYAIRVLLGSAMLYALFVVLSQHRAASGVMQLRDKSVVAQAFVSRVGVLQFVAIYLLVPLFLCGIVTAERDAQTLEQLFTTHLTNREIVFGKLASRLLVMFMLILSGVPIFNLFLLFGGSAAMIWRMEAASILAIVHVGSIGIYWATASRTAFQALWKTFASVLVLLPLPFLSPVFVVSAAVAGESITVTEIFILVISCVANLAMAAFFVVKASGRIRDQLPPKKLWAARLRKRHRQTAVVEQAQEVWAEHTEKVADKMRAVWGPLQISVVEGEPPISKNLWVLFPLAFAFLFNYLASVRFETETMSRILLPIWAGSFTLTVIVAITNPLFSRRPGFFDLLLGTLLEPSEILRGAAMVSGPWLIRIFLVPWVFGILWSSWNPIGILFVLATGTLFTCFILMVGNLSSLADHRAALRLGSTFLFPIVVSMGPWLLPRSVATLAPSVCWIASAVLLAVAWVWVRTKFSALAMGAFLTVLYFFLTASLVVLPGEFAGWWGGEFKALFLVSPWYWMLRALEVREAVTADMVAQYMLHWLAMIGTLAISWFWSLRHFDRLVGRTLQDKSAPQLPVASTVRLARAV